MWRCSSVFGGAKVDIRFFIRATAASSDTSPVSTSKTIDPDHGSNPDAHRDQAHRPCVELLQM